MYGKSQGALLKDLAKLNAAFVLFQHNEGEKARTILSQISASSPLYQLAENFSHFQK